MGSTGMGLRGRGRSRRRGGRGDEALEQLDLIERGLGIAGG